jgi:peptidoglycan-associated lipoprotein
MLTSFAYRAAPVVLVFAALPVLGCGGDKLPPPQAAAKPAATAALKPAPRLPPQAPDSPTASAVHISEEITTACGISDPDAYFAFDSANVRPDDARVLGQLVTCFGTGPLKGRTMKLVGHADPRGGSDYNMALGQSRADSVAGYMTGKGMDKSKAQSSTRGAMDATGYDDPSWARDRRVDIMLGQ